MILILSNNNTNILIIKIGVLHSTHGYAWRKSPYGSKKCFNYIMNGLYRPENNGGIAFEDKWLTLTDMGHIVATIYNNIIVELTNHEIGISKNFFPIRGSPTFNLNTYIMCLVLHTILKLRHGKMLLQIDNYCFETSWILKRRETTEKKI